MADLIIRRKKEFIYGLIGVNIYLDNKKLGNIARGELKKWKIEKGKHTLFAKGGLVLKSQKITFEAKHNEVFVMEIESFGNGYVKSFLQIKKLKIIYK